MPEKFKMAALADIDEIKKAPYLERVKANSALELIRNGAAIESDAVAFGFPSRYMVKFKVVLA